jgi:hypothetical protein
MYTILAYWSGAKEGRMFSKSKHKFLYVVNFIIRLTTCFGPCAGPSSGHKIYEEKLYSVSHKIWYKGKAVPLQAWGGPEGSRKLRFPDFLTTAQDGGKVVSLTRLPHLPPRKYSWYSFLLEAESTPGP